MRILLKSTQEFSEQTMTKTVKIPAGLYEGRLISAREALAWDDTQSSKIILTILISAQDGEIIRPKKSFFQRLFRR